MTFLTQLLTNYGQCCCQHVRQVNIFGKIVLRVGQHNSIFYSLYLVLNIDGRTPDDVPPQPQIIIHTRDDTITLPCQASGNPPPTIVWYKDGSRVTHNSRGVQMSADRKTLTIRRAETIHQGTYICVAMSSVGNATKTFIVNVNGKCL